MKQIDNNILHRFAELELQDVVRSATTLDTDVTDRLQDSHDGVIEES